MIFESYDRLIIYKNNQQDLSPNQKNRLFQMHQLENLLKKISLNQEDCLSVVPLKATLVPIDRFIKSEAIEVRSSLGILKTE